MRKVFVQKIRNHVRRHLGRFLVLLCDDGGICPCCQGPYDEPCWCKFCGMVLSEADKDDGLTDICRHCVDEVLPCGHPASGSECNDCPANKIWHSEQHSWCGCARPGAAVLVCGHCDCGIACEYFGCNGVASVEV